MIRLFIVLFVVGVVVSACGPTRHFVDMNDCKDQIDLPGGMHGGKCAEIKIKK